jgi:tubulin-specific chaperone D
MVSAAACVLISKTITAAEIESGEKSSVPAWRDILGHGLKHRNTTVQEAAAEALSSVSKLVDCSDVVDR